MPRKKARRSGDVLNAPATVAAKRYSDDGVGGREEAPKREYSDEERSEWESGVNFVVRRCRHSSSS